MKSQLNIETRGLIIKEEKVKALDEKILKNTLVLESTNPYLGYYGRNMPDIGAPRSIFFVLDKKYDALFLSRVLQVVSDKRPHKCYGAFGTIEIGKEVYHCIRIKNLDCFDALPEIQQMMKEEGIAFHKPKRVENTALIRIQKSFLIKEVEDEIYKDEFEKDRYYISMPFSLTFEEFRSSTMYVKNNIDNNLFDAALGILWRINGLIDIIRLYDKKHDINRIQMIRQLYISEATKVIQKRGKTSDLMSEAYL